MLFNRNGLNREQRKKFRQTVTELNSLNDRELSDLGIYRNDIKNIARDSVK